MKRIALNIGARKQPPPFEKVWKQLEQELRKPNVKTILTSAHVLRRLTLPMTDAFANVEDFGCALFKALRECLSDFEVEAGMDRNVIILKVDESGKYAVGMSCQNAVPPDFDENVGFYSSVQKSTTQNHCVCLFEKGDEGNWIVKDCFSTVQLGLSDTGCEDFSVFEFGEVAATNLADKHHALAEAILHTVQCDLLCHARRGLLPDDIPISIIAGRKRADNATIRTRSKAKKQKRPVKIHWLSGRLNIPKVCGDRFSYYVTDFGRFGEGSDIDVHSIKQALSVYIGSILFGLTSAIRAFKDIVGTNSLPPPVAASGRHVMIGELVLDLQLCASPIPGANPFQTRDDVDFWKSAQGDLFRGHVIVGDVVRAAGMAIMQHVDFLCSKPGTGKATAVVVKVSTFAVHNPLIDPISTMSALLEISKCDRELTREIGGVLHAAVKTNCGLVTVMADLSKQGYRALTPTKYARNINSLWVGFRELVERVLLPLAEIGVVHADIRPGFDVTSNILLKFDEKDKKARMKLVDYESLVHLNDWSEHPAYGSYLGGDLKWTGTTAVWWQCVYVGYVWCKQLNASEVEQSNVISDLCDQLLRGCMDLGDWNELRAYARQVTITEKCVKKTLDKIEIFLLHSLDNSFEVNRV